MEPDFKDILLFKTNIQTADDKMLIAKVMEKHKIEQWTVDQQDVDCVLRIVSPILKLDDVIQLVSKNGYQCEELT
ncbi:hypothetical protein [Pedobacter panaciterrae]|jgi:hypothetical protein|uniref:HMA domain-containing protein n=1 Tax=Pedobacter panaciterrae TaxID=363849 RepID=A0ABU8NH74_9SPHI|nr:hypothetical protein [Pedobacter panaciterrae]NQX57030.1 hypothetical protein [Pedobacter panaciterrae]